MTSAPGKAGRPQTKVAQAGRDPGRNEGAVNPPIHRATTIALPRVEALYGTPGKTYALEGMAVHEALIEALIAVEGGAGAVLAPSGLAACNLALLSFARAGGEILVTDSVYGPTRRFCDNVLARLGVTTRYFPPGLGEGLGAWMNGRTCGVFLESPGSWTFEVQDVAAIARIAGAAGVPVAIDNTWSAGVYLKPFDFGCDFSIQALTKYQAGHADAFVGAVLARTTEGAARLRALYKEMGFGVAPDDAYLALRGMRTLYTRLERQAHAARALAEWLAARPEVARVLHPALDQHPDHELWRAQFSGASGLFAFELKSPDPARLNDALERMRFFTMGFSWGGYESLLTPCDPKLKRSHPHDRQLAHLVRVSIGLEDVEDLKEDLEQLVRACA